MIYFAKFCGRNFAYGALCMVNWPVFTNIDMKYGHMDVIQNRTTTGKRDIIHKTGSMQGIAT